MHTYCHVQVDGVSYFPSPQLQKEPRQLAYADSSAFNELVMLEEPHFRKGREEAKTQTAASLGRCEIKTGT